MFKDYKTPEQLIKIMKVRKIQFSTEEEEKEMLHYLRYYTYNMIVNPYKVLYCSSIDNNGSHIYENDCASRELIELFEKSTNFNSILFKHLSDFEYNFSSILTDIYILHFDEIKDLLAIEVNDIIEQFNAEIEAHNAKGNNKELISVGENVIENIEVLRDEAKKNPCKRLVVSSEEKSRIRLFTRGDILKNPISNFFKETKDTIRYSYFHGANTKLTFSGKVTLFKLLPTKFQNNVISELGKIKENDSKKYYISRSINKFIININILVGIRNKVYHINSLPYFLYKQTKIELYKAQYNGFELTDYIYSIPNSIKFNNTMIMVVIKMLKLDKKGDPKENREIKDMIKVLREVFNNTKEKYEITKVLGESVTKAEFKQYLIDIELYDEVIKEDIA